MIQARNIRHVDRHATPVTMALIVVNVAIYLLGELSPDLGRRMFQEGAQFRPFIQDGEWYRAVTAMFLHGGLTHVAFNMYALYLFGPSLERRFGSIPFATLYLATGLGGSALFHLIGGNQPAVGASGAIFGLFGALLGASYQQRHTTAGRAVFSRLVMLLLINLALPLFVPRIAWEAHVGGLAFGLALAALWDRLPGGAAGVARRTAITAAFGAVAMAIILIV